MSNNKKEKTKFSELIKGRKFKYASLSVGFTACFIAVIILANAIITSVFTKYNVYSDLTSSSIYTLSDEAKSYLQYINNDIEIKFAVPLDTIKGSSSLNMVYLTALEYQEATKDSEYKITVSYFDSYLYPSQFAEYKELTSGDWESTNVIIESPNNAPLVYKLNAFFSANDGETVGYSGDRKFMSAFLQLAGVQRPIVCFTTGHGEIKGTQTTDANGTYTGYELPADAKYEEFFKMFDDVGFELRWLDLLKEDIPEECRLLVILDPQTDFIGKDINDLFGVSEFDKISQYMSKENSGSMMVFKGSTGSDFPILDEFLEEWGITIDSTKAVKESAENSISTDGATFSVKYTTDGLGASIQEKYRTLRTVFKDAAPMSISPNYNQYANYQTTSVFTTSPSAVVSDGEEYTTGIYDLMTLSQKRTYKDNEEVLSYLMACGCPEMLEYVGSQSFANREIINVLIKKLPMKKVPVDLDYKKFEDYGLSSITESAVSVWTVILSVAMPLAVITAGCVVVIRRKRR